MATTNLSPAIILVDARKLYYYAANGQALAIDLPDTIIRDYEVISRESLAKIIDQLIQSQKLTPSPLIQIYSENTYFSKAFSDPAPEVNEQQAKEFIETVPFERVLARNYPARSGLTTVALNRTTFEAIRDPFEAAGFPTLAVVPISVLSLLGIKNFDSAAVKTLIRRADELKGFSLAQIRQPTRTLQEQEEALAKKHTPLILAIFLGFIILVIGLTFFILTQQQQQVRKSTPSPRPPVAATLAPAIPTTTPGATVSGNFSP